MFKQFQAIHFPVEPITTHNVGLLWLDEKFLISSRVHINVLFHPPYNPLEIGHPNPSQFSQRWS